MREKTINHIPVSLWSGRGTEKLPQFHQKFEAGTLHSNRQRPRNSYFDGLMPLPITTFNRTWGLMFHLEKIFAAIIIIACTVAFLSFGGLAFILHSKIALLGAALAALLLVTWWLTVMLRVGNQSYPVHPEYGD